MTNESFEKRLKRFPDLQARMERILDITESRSGDILLGDDAEDRVTDELRQLGNEVLSGWVGSRSNEVSQSLKSSQLTKDVKKR